MIRGFVPVQFGISSQQQKSLEKKAEQVAIEVAQANTPSSLDRFWKQQERLLTPLSDYLRMAAAGELQGEKAQQVFATQLKRHARQLKESLRHLTPKPVELLDERLIFDVFEARCLPSRFERGLGDVLELQQQYKLMRDNTALGLAKHLAELPTMDKHGQKELLEALTLKLKLHHQALAESLTQRPTLQIPKQPFARPKVPDIDVEALLGRLNSGCMGEKPLPSGLSRAIHKLIRLQGEYLRREAVEEKLRRGVLSTPPGA